MHKAGHFRLEQQTQALISVTALHALAKETTIDAFANKLVWQPSFIASPIFLCVLMDQKVLFHIY